MKAKLFRASRSLLIVPALLLGLSFLTTVPDVASAACDPNNPTLSGGVECARGDDQADSLFGDGGVFRTVVNILLFLVGAISVIMLIIGGIRYVVSAGDQGAVTGAKNTILYAIIGIVVAFLAYAAVEFVTNQLLSSND